MITFYSFQVRYVFLLSWKKSSSFSYFVDHNEILVFAKFYGSDCSRLHPRVVKFSKFPSMLPDPPSFCVSCLRHSSLSLSRQYYTSSQLCHSRKKNRRRPCYLSFNPLLFADYICPFSKKLARRKCSLKCRLCNRNCGCCIKRFLREK